jgi:hypothetical protein
MRPTWSILALALALALAACAGPTPPPPTAVPTAAPTPIPPPTATPDPCAPENLQASIVPVDRLMREFDDASLLAQNTPQELLLTPISDLQRIRREAEDQEIPLCLLDLKSYQVAHMNTVIDVLIGFLKGVDADLINQGSAQARQLHDQYTIELARLLGITLVPADTETPAEGTALPEATSTP